MLDREDVLQMSRSRLSCVQLGLMVFRRSVFESRKKTRSILRTKARPPLRDILQVRPALLATTHLWPPTSGLLSYSSSSPPS